MRVLDMVRRKTAAIVVAFIILVPFLAWFFGIGWCKHTFMMPVEVEVERVDFPYDSESAFDTFGVTYYDLTIGKGKYQRAIDYLFYSPSFNIAYSNNYVACVQREYDRKHRGYRDDINIQKAREYDYNEFTSWSHMNFEEIQINEKGKTEKIVEITYTVPINEEFIEREKLTCDDKWEIVWFHDGEWYIHLTSLDYLTARTYPNGTTEVLAPVIMKSPAEERTVKYKITVTVPRNPLKGKIDTYCPNLL
jgi:hypothetical protein